MDNEKVLVPIRGGEASRRLGGLGRSTIYRLVKSNQLQVVRIGGRVFVTDESIRAFLERLVEVGQVHTEQGDVGRGRKPKDDNAMAEAKAAVIAKRTELFTDQGGSNPP